MCSSEKALRSLWVFSLSPQYVVNVYSSYNLVQIPCNTQNNFIIWIYDFIKPEHRICCFHEIYHIGIYVLTP